jgi:hypothetical protein
MAMRRSGLSAAQQAFALRARFPDVQGKLKAGRLVWTGSLEPTPLSRSYRVQIAFGPRGQPQVRVLDELATREGRSLPHVYSDGTLCLHETDEWVETMSIADTIVPWAAEWLAHYEIWLVTGEWYGGGEWPPRRTCTPEPAEEDGVKEPPTQAA